jgi:LysR family transcriptional regulator, glycine cleavage system transcriptional activator
MHKRMPSLSALRAFEAAARHLSFTVAANELSVTAGALSHQIRGLEEFLGVMLFERRVRSIALTPAGKQLYPGLQTGFGHIREAVNSLGAVAAGNVLVVSTSPGLTAKWLAPRLHRFSSAHPNIEVRIFSSSLADANFITDGVDMAIRNMSFEAALDRTQTIERLREISLVPVCSPRLLEKHGAVRSARQLSRLPLIHDDTLTGRVSIPTWTEWFAAAGVKDIELRRDLSFNMADDALDAAVEGAGVLLAHDLLAYDDLRTGRLVIPVRLGLAVKRGFHLVWPKWRKPTPAMEKFRDWMRKEIAALDWRHVKARIVP